MQSTRAPKVNAELLWRKAKIDELLELCPSPAGIENPKLLYYGGLAHHARGDKRTTIRCWRKALELDPIYEDVLRAFAHELSVSDKVLESASLFERLIATGRATADDWTVLGELRMKQDRMSDAARCLRRALAIEPENALALLAMATLHASMDEPDESLRYLQKTAATEDLDLSNLADDPVFEHLWNNPRFEKLVTAG